jgi:hypothetical protein
MKRLLLLCLLALAACQSEPDAASGDSGGQAAGDVLGGTISDDMIPLEQLTSKAPLAPREGRSAADLDAEQPETVGQQAPANAPAEAAPAEAAPAPAE